MITSETGMAHRSCNSSHGAKIGNFLRRPPRSEPALAKPTKLVGDDGGPLVAVGEIPSTFIDAGWLTGLLPVPEDATWPRVMSPPHPQAVGTLGWMVIERVERRRRSDPMVPPRQKTLRWWQKLLIVRMYEVDEQGVLVWKNIVLSTSRQVGKSVALRELALDRITQADHYGEAQLVLHTAKDLTIADEIQRPARQWAGIMEDRGSLWHPVGANGRWSVEYDGVMGRWLIRAQDSVYGFSASTALIDEGWAIDVKPVSEGIEPTMVEREQPQLLIVSTAHRKATPLVPQWRARALSQINNPTDTLILEWSAAPEAVADKGQLKYHRMASPHWVPHRQEFIGSRVNEDGFIEQWLNIWPDTSEHIEYMVLLDTWNSMAKPDLVIPSGPTAGHTVVIYPNVSQSAWHVVETGVDPDLKPSLRVVGTYPSMRQTLEVVGKLVRHAPADLIIPRFIRGRVPKLAGVRSMIQASESDMAAATTTVRPILSSTRLTHCGSEVLAVQMPRAVIDRYGDVIRITSKGSGVPVEAAKAAVLGIWWASRVDRPRAVVV